MIGTSSGGEAKHPTNRIGVGSVAAFFLGLFLVAGSLSAKGASEYVIIITVDGLRSSIFSELNGAQLPNFSRLRLEGSYTLNARTDVNWTYTNPNHVSVITARQVYTAQGHQYTYTGSAPAGETLHSIAGFYLTSIWDMAHDRGLRTGAYVGKPSQFSIIDLSYDGTNGAADVTGADNGRDKLDSYVANTVTSTLVDDFRLAMSTDPFNLSWFHFPDPDVVGHSLGWSSTNYRNAVVGVDSFLGSIFSTIDSSDRLRGKTTIILTADHGGDGLTHTDPTLLQNYRIPFFVWGAGVDPRRDLYTINLQSRRDPVTNRVSYATDPALQPIRNADAANLALGLLGLPAIPDSGAFINQNQDLRVALPSVAASSAQREPVALRTEPVQPVAVQLASESGPSAAVQKKARRRYSGVLADDGVTGQPLAIPPQ